jgi:phosphate transporter
MIGEERRGERDGQVKNLIPSSALNSTTPPLATIPTPFGGIKVTGSRISILVALTSFLTLLNVKAVEGPEANRCFAIFVFATILWATEVCVIYP